MESFKESGTLLTNIQVEKVLICFLREVFNGDLGQINQKGWDNFELLRVSPKARIRFGTDICIQMLHKANNNLKSNHKEKEPDITHSRHRPSSGRLHSLYINIFYPGKIKIQPLKLYRYFYFSGSLGNIGASYGNNLARGSESKVFQKLNANTNLEELTVTILAPETSKLFEEEAEKLCVASKTVPETQLQNYEKEDSETTTNGNKNYKHEGIKMKSKVLNPVERLEQDVGKDLSETDTNHVESPSILSYKNTQQSKVRGSSRSGNNIVEVKPKDLSTYSSLDTQSPSILSVDKAPKKCDISRNLIVNEGPGTSRVTGTNIQSDTHQQKNGSLSKKKDSNKNLPKYTSPTFQEEIRVGAPGFHPRNDISDEDDYMFEEPVKYAQIKKKCSSIKAIKTTNKWGIEISSDIPNAVSRADSLKQGSIQSFLRPKSALNSERKRRKKSSTHDLLDKDMQHALELSRIEAETSHSHMSFSPENVKENEHIDNSISKEQSEPHCNDVKYNYRNEHENRDNLDKYNSSERVPLMDVMDSFDCVPDTMMIKNNQNLGNSPKFKFIPSPIRKKADRMRLLQGHDCKDCRDFYKNDNLSETQLNDLLNKCSKHRSKCTPPPQSPQIRWHLDLEEDGPNDKTQIPSPLKTRDRRKLLRKF